MTFRTDWQELARTLKRPALIAYAARSMCYHQSGKDSYPKLTQADQAKWDRRASRTIRAHGIK